MTYMLSLLRGPVLGVIAMIIILAGIMVVVAFAALVAQMGLLLRLRPRENAGQTQIPHNSWGNNASNPSDYATRSTSTSRSGLTPQMSVGAQDFEVVDAVWWQESR